MGAKSQVHGHRPTARLTIDLVLRARDMSHVDNSVRWSLLRRLSDEGLALVWWGTRLGFVLGMCLVIVPFLSVY